MSPFIAELLGTMVMILLGDGVVANVVLKKTKGRSEEPRLNSSHEIPSRMPSSA